MLQLRNDIVPVRQRPADGSWSRSRSRGTIVPCRLQIGRDLRTVYGAGTSSDSGDELKIVTGFLQRPRPLSIALRRYVRARTNPIALSRKRIIVMVSLGIISALRVSWSPPLVKLWHAIPGSSHGTKSPVRQNVRFLRRSFWHNAGSRLGYVVADSIMS